MAIATIVRRRILAIAILSVDWPARRVNEIDADLHVVVTVERRVPRNRTRLVRLGPGRVIGRDRDKRIRQRPGPMTERVRNVVARRLRIRTVRSCRQRRNDHQRSHDNDTSKQASDGALPLHIRLPLKEDPAPQTIPPCAAVRSPHSRCCRPHGSPSANRAETPRALTPVRTLDDVSRCSSPAETPARERYAGRTALKSPRPPA